MKLSFGRIKKVVSLSVLIEGDKQIYNGVEVKFSKGEIEILKQYKDIVGAEDIIKKIGSARAILLHIEGKGVFNKTIDFSENYKQLLTANGNTNDFYFTDYRQGDSIYSSVVRKDLVFKLTNEFTARGGMIIGISSGPFIIMSIQPFLKESTIITRSHQLLFESNQMINFRKNEKGGKQTYRVGNEIVYEYNILSLAHAAIFFSSPENINITKNSVEIENHIEEAGQKVLFQQFGFFLMGFFLFALLANYMYLAYLNKRYQENSIELAEYTEVFNEIGKLEEEKQRKEALLRTSGILTKKFISFYISHISNSVPNEISLTDFTVKPVKDEIKERYKVEVDNQHILIKGISQSSRYLSEWVSNLSSFNWIRKVEIEEYDFIKGQGKFYLRIVI